MEFDERGGGRGRPNGSQQGGRKEKSRQRGGRLSGRKSRKDLGEKGDELEPFLNSLARSNR